MMPNVDETRSMETLSVRKALPVRITPHQHFLIRPLRILFALFLLTALIYSNAVSASFQFDDIRLIVENPVIKNLKNFLNFSDARYIGDLSFALNYRVGGLAVLGYHVVNILIHLTNGYLIYLLVLLLFHTPVMAVAPHQLQWTVPSNPRAVSALPDGAHGIALFAALLFLAHPIQTQAVTYIAQRFTSLATLFYLLTVVCYVKWRLSSPEGKGRYLWYVCALLSAVLAMKTKEISFTLPLMLVLVEMVFYRSFTRQHWFAVIPFLVTLFIVPFSHMGELHAAASHGISGVSADVPATSAAPDMIQISRWAAVVTQVRATMTYFRLLIFPVHQNLDYDYPIYLSFFRPPVVFSAVVLLSLFVLAISLMRRSEQSVYNPQRRLFAFGILWVLLTLSLEAAFSVLVFRDAIIEHRLYLPSVGFFVAASAAGSWLYLRVPDRVQWVAICLAVCSVALLSVATYQRNRVWWDEPSLWTDVVRKSPGKVRPHDNLGVALRRSGDFEGAIREYRVALRLNPNDANTYDNLGVALYDKGDLEGAMVAYRTALRLNPNDANAYDNLGVALYAKGDLEGAIAAFRTALRLNPNDADAYNNLGAALYAKGDLEGTIEAYHAALHLAPNVATTYYHLGVALMDQGNGSAAAQQLLEFLRLAPNTPSMHQHLDDAKRKLGKLGGVKRGG